MTMDWYCEAFRCWMTKTACDLRRKRAVNGTYYDRQRYANAGCGTCQQNSTKPRPVEPEPAAQTETIQEVIMEQTPSIQKKATRPTAEIPKEKPCTRCKQVKKLDLFSNAKLGLYGKKSTCKNCDTERYLAIKATVKENAIVADTVKKATSIIPEPINLKADKAAPKPIVEAPEVVSATFDPNPAPLLRSTKRLLCGNSENKTIMDQNHTAPATSGKECIFIDMTEYPEIHQAIMEISKQEFRSPEMQVLFWLKKHLASQTL